MNDMEIWKEVPGFGGLYHISDQGRVKQVIATRKIKAETILPTYLNNSGYLRVHLKRKMLYVHHLVAAAFVGPRPAGFDVNHKNGQKTDNRAINLNYMTRRENMRHAREHGLQDNRGEKAWNAKLTEADVRDILFYNSLVGLTNREWAQAFGVAEATINCVFARKTWRHVTDEFAERE